MEDETTDGLGRRDLLKRGAVLGGAVLWTAPVVQSLASPAFAAGSPAGEECSYTVRITLQDGTTSCTKVSASTTACCDTLRNAINNPVPNALTAIINALLSADCQNIGTLGPC